MEFDPAVLDQYEVAQGHVVAYLTAIHSNMTSPNGEKIEFDWWEIPMEGFGAFIMTMGTQFYCMLAYLAYKDGTTISELLQQLRMDTLMKLTELRGKGEMSD
jgi:hypothetical protein